MKEGEKKKEEGNEISMWGGLPERLTVVSARRTCLDTASSSKRRGACFSNQLGIGLTQVLGPQSLNSATGMSNLI